MDDTKQEKLAEVKNILVSQPQPVDVLKSPYAALEKKYGVKVSYRSFIKVAGLEAKDFRKEKINLADYKGVIFSSKYAVDHYFRLCDEMRIKTSEETKYFCNTEVVALYLQKHIVYRKRKVFHGERSLEDIKAALIKHKKKDKLLLPISNFGAKDITDFLKEKEIEVTTAHMYNTVSDNLNDLDIRSYDMLVFFTQQGPESLFENFPNFEQKGMRIATFGKTAHQSALAKGLKVDIVAPSPENPSIIGAIDSYLKKANPTDKQ